MTSQQFLIDSLSDTFARRCDELVAQNNLLAARALYEEWVVDGCDPEDGNYEWIFIPNLTAS
jgi:hypothetical protein